MKLCRDLSDLVVYTNSVAAQDIIDDGKALHEFLFLMELYLFVPV